MAIKTKKFDCKDSEDKIMKVEITNFLGSTGVKIFAKLTKMVLPVFGAIKIRSSLKEMIDQDLDLEKITQHLISNLDDDKIYDLIVELMQSTFIDGQDLSDNAVFDSVFAGEYGLLLQILRHVLEVNYSSFLGKKGIKNWMNQAKSMIPKANEK